MMVVVLSSSCSLVQEHKSLINYPEALNKVRTTATSCGIPRQKLFYHFQLYGVASTRWSGGVRGGCSSQSEHWDLPDGSKLSAYKHSRVAKIVIRAFKAGEGGNILPFRFASDERYYHEPRLEPYFDALYLMNARKQLVGKIELPLSQ